MKNYILYGAAGFGRLIGNSLKECGINVVGYVDKRAFELSTWNNLPVWSICDIPQKYTASDTVIYISVKNVFEHEQIVAEFREKTNYRKIIYKPYSVLLGYGSKDEIKISEIWDNLPNGRVDFQLPELNRCKLKHDFAYIEGQEEVKAYIPAEFIFTNDYQNSAMSQWGNICILALYTHIEFFHFLDNKSNVRPDDYLEKFHAYSAGVGDNVEITNAWKDNVVKNRTQVYEQMKESMDLDPLFFVRNAAEARWNEDKKYFNLTSGKHRTTFQVAMGKKYIPLKITKTDYAKFVHESEVESTIQLLEDVKKDVMIPHPFFYRGEYKDRNEYHFLTWFAQYFGKKLYYENNKIWFEKLNIIDYTNDFGNFARFCERLGCRVQRRGSLELLEEQLNRLFYTNRIDYEAQINSVENNVIVMDADNTEVMNKAEISLYLSKGNTWIVKYATQEMIKAFAAKYSLRIISKINTKYEEGSILQSYLLEK